MESRLQAVPSTWGFRLKAGLQHDVTAGLRRLAPITRASRLINRRLTEHWCAGDAGAVEVVEPERPVPWATPALTRWKVGQRGVSQPGLTSEPLQHREGTGGWGSPGYGCAHLWDQAGHPLLDPGDDQHIAIVGIVIVKEDRRLVVVIGVVRRRVVVRIVRMPDLGKCVGTSVRPVE